MQVIHHAYANRAEAGRNRGGVQANHLLDVHQDLLPDQHLRHYRRWHGAGEEEEQALRQLASEIGAEFVKTKSPDFAFPNPCIKVVKRVGNWTITLDTEEGSSGGGPHHSGSTHTFTRVRAPYVSKDGFRFEIYRNDLVIRLLTKVFRQKVVKLGDPDFDRYLLITANDEQKVWALFANSTVRRLIQRETRFPRAFQPKSHGRLVGVHILE
ncbi:unnamed protein product, partial [marine sediment metagenome]